MALVWRLPQGAELGQAIVLPILTTIVYAFVWADASDTPVSPSAVWERCLERSWAVIVIDFVYTFVASLGLGYALSADPIGVVTGIVGIVLSIVLVFADASATVDDDVNAWSVIPHAFVRSASMAWRAAIFPRALTIFAIELLVLAAQSALAIGLERVHVPQAVFWSEVLLNTLTLPPLSALIVLVYRDATVQKGADVAH